MWFLGVLVGLGLGAAFDSLSAALILGGAGGFIVALFRRQDKAVTSDAQVAQLADLHRKVVYLYTRLEDLEARLAGGVASDAKPMPAASPSAAPELVGPLAARAESESPAPSLAEHGQTMGDRIILSLANAAPPAVGGGIPPESAEPEIFLDETPARAGPDIMKSVVEEAPEPTPEPEPALEPEPEPAIPLRDRLPAPLRELI
ncbi:MAG: hypothetical protein ACM3SV_04295, partial [Betaproteobacteria bacterium]